MSEDNKPTDWSVTLSPCSDGNCIFGRPKGMHTNGGCMHLKLSLPETQRLLRLVLKKYLEHP